jgi:predicted Zn finger-like uncharacterized protein
MALMTACPACHTQFKIVPDQLRLHSGLVRCGSCNHVFDASKALLSVPTQVGGVPPPNEPPVWKSKAVVQALIAKPAPEPPPQAPAEAATALPQLITHNSKDEHLVDANDLSRRDWAELNTPAHREVSAFGPLLKASFWLFTAFLTVLAAAQIAMMSRFAIASYLPAAQPFLTALCRPFGCTVQPARTLQPLTLETLTLKRTSSPEDVTQPAAYELQANISNASRLAVLAPQLELSLTNSQTQTIARRVLTTAELGAVSPAIGAQSEWNIKINLRLDPQTAGFTGRLIGSATAP